MFSGFYEALGNVMPEGTSPSPSRPTNTNGNPLARDGSPQRQNGEASYSTYQRRSKPSLEERLRASLAAKEQKRLAQEKESNVLSTIPAVEEKQEEPDPISQTGTIEPPSVLDPLSIPLPTSPPTVNADPVNVPLSIPDSRQPQSQELSTILDAVSATPAQPVTPPNRTNPPLPPSEPTDPLSPFPSATRSISVQDPIQELSLPASAVSSKFDDPLTPALMELEREQQAAAAKARLARSPPPPSSPPKQHHVRTKSNATKPTVPDGEPFLRLGSHSQSISRSSLDQILHAPTSSFGSLGVEGVEDLDGLKAWIEEIKRKSQASEEEVRRLNAKLQQQDSRIEELRDTHRLEAQSQSELIESLRQKLAVAETQIASLETTVATERSLLHAERSTRESLIAAERAKNSTGLADLDTLKAKVKELSDENEKLQSLAKEEEEKRTKAISLLKTDSERLGEKKSDEELKGLRVEVERLTAESERVRIDSAREVERIRDEIKRDFERRRTQLEAELAAIRDGMEREVLARRGEWEIEGMAAKTAHQKEVTALNTRISSLSASLNQLAEEKETLFSELQARQGELEAARSTATQAEAQLAEINYQLEEKDGRIALLAAELADAQRSSTPRQMARGSSAATSSADVARLLAETKSKSEAQIAELQSRLKAIELDRTEQEESWSRTIAARGQEIERLRRLLDQQENEGKKAGDYRAQRDKDFEQLEERIRRVEKEKLEETRRYKLVESEVSILKESLESRSFEASELQSRVETLNTQLEELRAKESQLKTSNKTLRDELRKVQSSAALLERQRNPGVGWSGSSARPTHDTVSTPDLSRGGALIGRPGTPKSATTPTNGTGPASSAGSARSSMEVSQPEEEVNVEYLRNVILQFLEHKEMRPNLVRVLSVLLRFSPQETRRLIAKV
ncbi:SubName: Full=Uncharacterized protein {ECO:0000313/EMBL:CCA74368.1} [Serendipita indica DSM 11827]|nr:SubName: Full=Uncharacterized protein {ECO:0000313/EMBL:CCA74368.1} [Serendipita indica DSM 11827]